ncbi:hypothetical protein [Kineococcus aurantiacus]|uniref:Uncharacterized protein n=1 Tax=Kineococcus aurantiacus TaxID=37633 RepID=A0A7Y9DN72_9ACTN|nr:hypothetical protein [Kineococcus aurantiacus]NYD23712.1 hypothetical protein [Kineococcus aurantiacus]
MTSNQHGTASLAARAGGAVVHGIRSVLDHAGSGPGSGAPASGWLAVTVLGEPSDVDAAPLPAPLAEYGDRIEVRTRQAPGGKGTELAARLRDRSSGGSGSTARHLSGSDPQADLRSALRRAKQLLEVGEVLAVDPAPHGERTATPGGLLLEAWTRVAPKGGVR